MHLCDYFENVIPEHVFWNDGTFFKFCIFMFLWMWLFRAQGLEIYETSLTPRLLHTSTIYHNSVNIKSHLAFDGRLFNITLQTAIIRHQIDSVFFPERAYTQQDRHQCPNCLSICLYGTFPKCLATTSCMSKSATAKVVWRVENRLTSPVDCRQRGLQELAHLLLLW